MEAELKTLQVTFDVSDLRSIYNRYGQAATDAALDKIASDVKAKIRSVLKLGEQVGTIKSLVEVVK